MSTKNDYLPDFLIVGAAKSGTTSLYNYLKQNKQIFLPENKEPKYFVSKILKYPLGGKGDNLTEELMIKDFENYLSLFKQKKDNQICGEASVDYLYYADHVAPLIRQKLGDVKIIIMLRNPVDRAFSAYKHLVRDVRENESFEKALELEQKRKFNNYEFIWHYKQAGLYYKSVKKYYQTFTNVKVIIFEEFVINPKTTLNEVYKFLGVNIDNNVDTKKIYNKTGKPRFKTLQKALKGNPNQLSRKVGRHLFPKKYRIIIRDFLEVKNIKEKDLVLKKETSKLLEEFYKEDIYLLDREFGIKLNT
jgi:hypothetical protein